MELIWIFLPAIIILGLFTSYTDIRSGKIRNKHIFLALVYAVVVYAIMSIFVYFDRQYLFIFVINFLFSGIVSVFLWEYKLWSAGDAKLFIAYSALIPLSMYAVGYIDHFPSGVIFVNTFVPLFLILSFYLFFKTDKSQKISALKLTFNPKKLLSSFISVFAIYWLIGVLFAQIGLPLNYFIEIILSILMFYVLEKKLGKNLFFVAVLIIVIRLIADSSVYTMGFVKESVFLFLLWVMIKGFIDNMSTFSVTKKVSIEELEPGMYLAEDIVSDHGIYKKSNKREDPILPIREKIDSSESSMSKKIGDKPGGLTAKEVDDIKREHKLKKISFDTVLINETMPFAPSLFIGVLLTLAVKGSIFVFLINLFL